MDRLIDPVIADMQREHAEAVRTGRRWSGAWVLAMGYLAFAKVVALQLSTATWRALFSSPASSGRGVVRALAAAGMTMIVVTVLFVLPPLQAFSDRRPHRVWLIVLLLPQTVPISLPLAVLVGVLSGMRGRRLTRNIARTIVIVGLAGSLASLGAINWWIPAANQAFRVTIAGQHVERGPSELPLSTLRERALSAATSENPKQGGALMLGYHLRGALVGATLVFALYGLGLATLGLGRAKTASLAAVGSVVYITYIFELSGVDSAIFVDERLAILMAWLPNLALIIASTALLCARRDASDAT